MESPIIGSYRLTVEEMLVPQQIHARHSGFGKHQLFPLIVGPFLLVIGTLVLLNGGYLPFGIALLAMGLVLLATPWWQRRAFLKHHAKRPDRDMLVSWEAYPDRILFKTDASSTSTEWRMIVRVLRTPRGFLVYFNEYALYWLPLHSFSRSTDVEAFASLAKSKTKEYKQVA